MWIMQNNKGRKKKKKKTVIEMQKYKIGGIKE